MTRLLLSLCLLLSAGCGRSLVVDQATPAATGQANSGARATLDAHLDAIRRHDLAALIPTVTTRDSLVLIFPDGTLIRSRADFLSIHQEWFADTSWTIRFDPIDTVETQNLFVATLRTTITDSSPRSGRQALLSLTFLFDNGTWGLVHDQNTALPFPAQ